MVRCQNSDPFCLKITDIPSLPPKLGNNSSLAMEVRDFGKKADLGGCDFRRNLFISALGSLQLY